MLTWEEEVLPLSSVPLQGIISPPPAVASPSPTTRILDDGAVVSATAPAPAAPVNTPFRQTAPATSMPNTAPLSEDPFQVRLDLADELWKLGQRQTGRALAQEVADQTHGETRERALRWLQERS